MAATRNLRENRKYGFPLRGKLSPQVTDEGVLAGHFPLIRRAGAPPSPQGEGFLYARRNHADKSFQQFFHRAHNIFVFWR
jgi:hypothetical protein